MAKTFSELQALALQIRDEILEKKNTAPRVGAALLDMIDNTIQNITDINQKLSVFEHACSGFKRVESESQLPVTPPEDEKTVGYLVGKNLYLYVGKDGNAVNGRYFNVGNITGPQGEIGPQGIKGDNGKNGVDGKDGKDGKDGDRGPQGNSGITGSTEDLDVINDLSGGESTPGRIKVLAAEQGKSLMSKIGSKGDALIRYTNRFYFANRLCRIDKKGFYVSNSSWNIYLEGTEDFIKDIDDVGEKLLVLDLDVVLTRGEKRQNYININWSLISDALRIINLISDDHIGDSGKDTNYIALGLWENGIYRAVNCSLLNRFINNEYREASFYFNGLPTAFFSGSSLVIKTGVLLKPLFGKNIYLLGEKILTTDKYWFIDLSVLNTSPRTRTTDLYDEIDINTSGLFVDINKNEFLTEQNPNYIPVLLGYSSHVNIVENGGLFDSFVNSQKSNNNAISLMSKSGDISFVGDKVYIRKDGFRLIFPSTNDYILIESFTDDSKSMVVLDFMEDSVCIDLDVLFKSMSHNGYYYTVKLDTPGLFTTHNYSDNMDGYLLLYNVYYGKILMSGGLFIETLIQQGKNGNIFDYSYKFNSAETLAAISPYFYDYDIDSDKRTKRFNIAFLTDCHIESHPNSTENLQEAIKFLNSKPVVDSISCIINGGDNVSGQQGGEEQRADMRLFTAINKLSTVPVLPVVGNHDNNYWQYDGSPSLVADCIDQAEMREILTEPLVGGIDNVHLVENNTYYYLDFPEDKIRIIVLNCVDVPLVEGEGGKNKYGGLFIYRQEQIDWLVNNALEIPKDYGVIVCNHTIPNYTYSNQGKDFPQGVNTIPEIIDAFKHGKNINKTFNDTSGNGFNISVNKDFSQKGAQNFMFWLVGHYHRDMVLENGTYTDQKIISGINCGCVQEGGITRIPDSITKIGFNILCIDKVKRKIYKALYGAWQNTEGTNKRIDVIDF